MFAGLLSYFRWTAGLAASPTNMERMSEALLRSSLATVSLASGRPDRSLRSGIPDGHLEPSLDGVNLTVSPGFALIHAPAETDPHLLGRVDAAILVSAFNASIVNPPEAQRPAFTRVTIEPTKFTDSESVEAFHNGTIEALPTNTRTVVSGVVGVRLGDTTELPAVEGATVATIYHAPGGANILFDARPALDIGDSPNYEPHPHPGRRTTAAPVWSGAGMRFYIPPYQVRSRWGSVDCGDEIADLGVPAGPRSVLVYVDPRTGTLGQYNFGDPDPPDLDESIGVAIISVPNGATDGGDCTTAYALSDARPFKGDNIGRTFTWEGASWNMSSDVAPPSESMYRLNVDLSTQITGAFKVEYGSASFFLDQTSGLQFLDTGSLLSAVGGDLTWNGNGDVDVQAKSGSVNIESPAIALKGNVAVTEGVLSTRGVVLGQTNADIIDLGAGTVRLPEILSMPGGFDGYVSGSVPASDFENAYIARPFSSGADVVSLFGRWALRASALGTTTFYVPLRLPAQGWVRRLSIPVTTGLFSSATLSEVGVFIQIVSWSPSFGMEEVTSPVEVALVDGDVAWYDSGVLARSLENNLNFPGSTELMIRVQVNRTGGATGEVVLLFGTALLDWGMPNLFEKV